MTKFVILRDANKTFTAEPFAPSSRILKSTRTAPPSPRFEIATLQPKDIGQIAKDPQVLGIARDMPTRLIAPFNPASSANTAWGIGAVGATTSPYTGAGALVAVLDTGIAASHDAFAGVTLVERDFSGAGNGDRNGHGTHCAGTIFGRDVGGQRIGVARGVTNALIGKVLDDAGRGSSAMLFSALAWAIESSADVISMSLGFDFPGLVDHLITNEKWPPALAASAALEAYRGNLRMFDALMELNDAQAGFGQGAVVVAAAGNESERATNPNFEIGASLPACAEGVVSVAALAEGQNGFEIAPFSNTFVQVSAPGVSVLSADARNKSGLRTLTGTSMACPHAAGVAALWCEVLKQSSVPGIARGVLSKLLATAQTNTLNAAIDPADRGYGIVQAPQ